MPKDEVEVIILLYRAFWVGAALIWVMSAIWVVHDSSRRLRHWWARGLWGLLALLLPVAGLALYGLFRPRKTFADRRELELLEEIQRARRSEDRCPVCRAEVRSDFVACPSCGEHLRTRCKGCGEALELHWLLCPYCEEHERAGEPLHDPSVADAPLQRAAEEVPPAEPAEKKSAARPRRARRSPTRAA